ncbi:uncharacterized protein LOC132196623 isoform X2 [Neocloeon triangulifer]|uniref:uncharacterized protein LOC132196623 isoform X2 n=1 Tax=Neocloeon triangulifer TaxID=2078957 RepID=UPI00286F0E8B|nr:uncharacterized protein LOC132196623 isoform X2 [Neocloeon triangulifer]
MSSSWLLDLDEEVSALRGVSRRRVQVAKDDFALFTDRRVGSASSTVAQLDTWLANHMTCSRSSSYFKKWRSGSQRVFSDDEDDELVPPLSSKQEDTHSLRHLRERNKKLEAVINDVMEVNKRWQKHHSEREVYLQKLQNTIAELQQRELQSAVKENSSPTSLTVTPERLAQIEADNAQLRLDLESAHRKVQAMEKEHREHVQLLNIQVRSYRDDWEAERREKEQALIDKATLEERCRNLEEKLLSEKQKVTPPVEKAVMNIAPCGCAQEAPVACRRDCHHANKNSTFRSSVHLPCISNKASRRRATLESSQSIDSSRTSSPSASVSTESGIVTIGFEDGLASVTSFTYPPDTPFSISSKSLEIPAANSDGETEDWCQGRNDEGVLTQTNEQVICPRCKRVFPPDKHIDFLDHFDHCPDQPQYTICK